MNRKYRKTVIAGNWKMNMLASEVKPFVEQLKENALVLEADHAVAVGRVDRLDHAGQQAVTEGELDALAGLLARAGQAFPDAVAVVGQQNDLDRRGAPLGLPHQASRDDAGIVHHETITRLEVVQQIVKMAVRQFAGRPIHDEHTGAVPLRERMLCDETFGQIKIKIAFLHSMRRGVYPASSLFGITEPRCR